mmetsp:Transcript_20799/g.44858  ORF Transcript_20799/g.44858 Transcript_20799/m.44858 type:complete len:114 (-) Transcript_20799:374-715(-)
MASKAEGSSPGASIPQEAVNPVSPAGPEDPIREEDPIEEAASDAASEGIGGMIGGRPERDSAKLSVAPGMGGGGIGAAQASEVLLARESTVIAEDDMFSSAPMSPIAVACCVL